MDRDAILGAMPSNEEFQAAPDYRKQQIVANLIRAILDALNQEGREPDRWEGQNIAQAIGFLLAQWYRAAAAAAGIAMTPPNERAKPETWGRADDTVTARALRHALEYAAGRPAVNRLSTRTKNGTVSPAFEMSEKKALRVQGFFCLMALRWCRRELLDPAFDALPQPANSLVGGTGIEPVTPAV